MTNCRGCATLFEDKRQGGFKLHKRGSGQWALVVALAVAGGATTLVNALGWGHWKWLAVTAAVVVLVAAVPFKIVSARVEAGVERRRVLASSSVGGARGRVRDVEDPTRLGVHPAVRPDHGRLPPYVRRDQHDAVVKRLVPGAFVLIQGDSGAGKSRLAFEAVREVLPKHVLFAPEPAALGAAIEEMRQANSAVLWLNDLDRYLEADALTPTGLGELLTGHRVVVATLRHQAREAMLATEDTTSGVVDQRQRLLELAELVLISREFTTTELDRARELSGDPRIADALAHADRYGLAEYLAAGPQLRDKWLAGKDTHPRGAALVSAAVDCRRAGFITPLPIALLNTVHTHYLPPNPRTRIEDLDAAWRWATELWQQTSALLEPINTGEDAVLVFDYLIDHIQRTTPVDNDPPQQVLETALAYADASTATAIGNHAHQRGRYSLALTAHQHALTHHTDPNSRSTLISRNNLAGVLSDLGRLEEAEQEHRAVRDIQMQVFGPSHPDTLTSRNNLATVLRDSGRLEEAERELRAVRDNRMQVFGLDHPDTLTSRNNLATVLSNLGRLEEAEQELRAVRDIRMQVFGADHPNMLTSRNNLATVLRELGRLEEAERELRAVLDVSVRVLGPDHPNALASRNNLAMVLSNLGRLEEAEREHRAVLDVSVRVLGPDHPNTLTSRNNLAMMLSNLGRLEEAEQEHRAVRDIRMQLFGLDHPDTLTSRNNLATVLWELGRLEEAERELRAVLDVSARVLGPDHPNTVISRNNLATVLADLRRRS